MENSEEKKKLFKLLFQINDYTNKINEMIKEVNILIQNLNLSSLNLTQYIEQLNASVNSMKLDIKNYYDQFRVNKVEIPEDKELNIYIGFKQPSGVVHTLEAQYGTTVDKLISTYLKIVDQNHNEFIFEYKNKELKLGDMTLIENIFNDRQNPTVMVKNANDLNNLNKNNKVMKYTDIDFII